MVQDTFEAKEVALGKLFDNDYLFRMPVYQRPYSWTPEETEALLNDLIGAMEDETSAAEPYFLGSIVLIARPNSREHEVIDGQQRLTTLTMLFCVLRELTDDDDKRNSLDDRIRERRDVFAGRRDRFRLEIRGRDQDFFHDNVQESRRLVDFLARCETRPPDTDSRRLIFESARFLYNQLSELDSESRDALSQFVITRCYLVVVSAYNRDSAHRIFSVLNARGRDLTPTDILKSDVIGEIPIGRADFYAELWEDTEDELGRERFRELFAHIFVIQTGNRFHKELAKAFKEQALVEVNGTAFVDDVLIPYTEAFRVVTSAEYESLALARGILHVPRGNHAKHINRMLGHLGRLDNDDWIPAAMVFYHLYKEDSETLMKLLTELDRLAYSMFIRGIRRDPRIVRYRPVIESAKSGASGLDATIASLQISDSERKEVIALLDAPVYRPRQIARFTRPLLLRLDSALVDTGASYDRKTITVEHVLPQSPEPDSEWIRNFPDEEQRLEWTHKLANLVLLSRSKNAKAQNFDFDRKKAEYFNRGSVPNFALTIQVTTEKAWTPRVLEKRQKALIDLLKAEWRLE